LGKWVAKQREQYKLKLKGQHSFLTPYREEKLNQAGFSWHVRNSLDSEVQTVMDELIHNNRNALAATTGPTSSSTNDDTNDNVDGVTAETEDTTEVAQDTTVNPIKEEEEEEGDIVEAVPPNDATARVEV
jgi:hypothetical protein